MFIAATVEYSSLKIKLELLKAQATRAGTEYSEQPYMQQNTVTPYDFSHPKSTSKKNLPTEEKKRQ